MRITLELEINEEQMDILIDINNGIFENYDSWIDNARKMVRVGLLMVEEVADEDDPDDVRCRYRFTGAGIEVLRQAAAEQVMN